MFLFLISIIWNISHITFLSNNFQYCAMAILLSIRGEIYRRHSYFMTLNYSKLMILYYPTLKPMGLCEFFAISNFSFWKMGEQISPSPYNFRYVSLNQTILTINMQFKILRMKLLLVMLGRKFGSIAVVLWISSQCVRFMSFRPSSFKIF